jgi:hypothetical protein
LEYNIPNSSKLRSVRERSSFGIGTGWSTRGIVKLPETTKRALI